VATLLVAVQPLRSQTITEDFTGPTAPNWTLGGTTTPVLTGDGVTDPVGQGYLRLTPLTGNQATYAYYNGTPLASANRSFYGSFDFKAWDQAGAGAADGIVFYLYDGSQAFAQGANGGSLGYAQKTGVNGKPGGYMGLAIDDWGNYSNPTEGRIGGPGFKPNAIVVRGPGSGTSGYDYIAGTGDGTNPALSTTLDFPLATTRPSAAADLRHLQFTLSPTGQLLVYLQVGTGSLQEVLSADLSGYTRPDTLGFGFASGTGAAESYHEVRNYSITSLVANLWDNGAGTSTWANAVNWNPDVLPVNGGDVLFDNTFVNTAQTVDLGGVARQVRSVSFAGPVAYTLNNGTLNFDSGTPGTPVLINATQTGSGGANQIINANLSLTADLVIGNSLDTTYGLTINGTTDTGGHNIQTTGTGTTTMNGVISNTGSLTKSGTGKLVVAGNNTYSGGTTLQLGTLSLGHNNALGTGALTITGGALEANGGSRTIGNTTALQGNVTISGSNAISFSGQWSESGGNQTITVSNSASTTFSSIVLSESGQARTLDMNVGSGGTTVSGVISDGAGAGAGSLTKDGTGTLTLSGANTYTGTTTINAGTIQITASDRLNNTSNMSLNGGTFNLNGSYSQRVNTLNYNNGTLDYGTTGTANNFMFGAAGTQAGTLTVNNWESGVDSLAILSAAPAPSAAFLNNIYFSGVGSGAALGAPNTTITGYGSIWTPLTPAVNPTYTWNGGSGVNNNWSQNPNWVGVVAPPTGSTTTRLIFTGNTRLTPNMQNNYTVNSIKFDSAAGAFTLGPVGKNLTMGGVLPSIIQQSANNETIISPIKMNPSSGGAMVVDVSGTGSLTISSVISEIPAGTAITKVGGSSLILSGANTFTGAVNIDAGTINIQNSTALGTGAGGVTVAKGAALEMQNNIAVTGTALSINGTGVGGNGVVRNVSGNNSWAGAVTMTGDSRIQSDAGTLTVSGDESGNYNLNIGGAGNVTMSGAIGTGTGTLTKDGAGTLTLSGTTANTFTGDTTVNAGELDLNKTAGVNAIAGNLNIGDGSGTDTVKLLASNQINATAIVNVASSGVLNLNGFNQTVSGLDSVSSAASVQLGAGTLTVDSFQNSSFAGVISGTGGTLVKQGADTFTITGANTYTGTTTVSAGVLNIQNSSALGTTAGGTSVTSGATLQMQGGISVGTEALTLNGTGVGGNGALRNISGNNSWAGAVTLGSAAQINSDAGTLTVSGNVNNGGFLMTVGGAGNTTMTGIVSGTGGLTQSGTGTLMLNGSANNTFTGATTINAGTLQLSATGALATTSSITINSGGTLLLSGASTDRIGNTVAVTLAGGTLTSQDVTEVMGALTMTAASVINLGTDGADGTFQDLTFASLTDNGGAVVINNWSGKQFSSGSDDRIFLTGTAPGTIFGDVSFTGFNQGGIVLASHELVPIPEPGTVIGGSLIAGLIGLSVLRRRAKK